MRSQFFDINTDVFDQTNTFSITWHSVMPLVSFSQFTLVGIFLLLTVSAYSRGRFSARGTDIKNNAIESNRNKCTIIPWYNHAPPFNFNLMLIELYLFLLKSQYGKLFSKIHFFQSHISAYLTWSSLHIFFSINKHNNSIS